MNKINFLFLLYINSVLYPIKHSFNIIDKNGIIKIDYFQQIKKLVILENGIIIIILIL